MTTLAKRGLTTLVLLLLIPIAFAAHTATVSTNYASVYETNEANITLNVANDFASTSTINSVDVATDGFSIQNIIALVDWAVSNNNSITFTTALAGISNWGSQNFGFSALANNVNQDTIYTWTTTTTDTQGSPQTQQLQLTVLNDNTAPILGAITPGAFIPGSNTELFSIAATDAETAISNGNLYSSTCDLIVDPLTNLSSMQYTPALLACANGVCSLSQDLSSWTEGDVCFYFDVSNAGGETATSNNLVTIIDRTAPTVTANTPINGAFLTTQSLNLDFSAQDNYDTTLDCTVTSDGNNNQVTTSTVNNTYALNSLSDGLHTWSVSCSDDVGLIGTTNSQSYNIDTQGPVITLTVPSIVDRGTNAVIVTDITDLGSGVNQSSIIATITDPNSNQTLVSVVNGQVVFPTTTAFLPGTYTLQVDAADNLGQQSTQSVSFRLRETYSLTLTLAQQQIDASTPNNTYFVNATGFIVEDNGTIPVGTIDFTGIVSNSVLTIDSLGGFLESVEIPQTNGIYTIIATFVNGIDSFNATASIAVGPYCGNGVIDNNEQCDGGNLNGLSCSTQGYSQGTVSCTATCTIDSSQCSNPPPAPSSSGGSSGGSGGHSSSSGTFITPIIPIEEDLISGIVETPEVVVPVVEEETTSSGVITTNATQQQPEGIGIGAAWAAFIDYASAFNKAILALLLMVALLLYLFGWRNKKKDDFDRYFEKYGHK